MSLPGHRGDGPIVEGIPSQPAVRGCGANAAEAPPGRRRGPIRDDGGPEIRLALHGLLGDSPGKLQGKQIHIVVIVPELRGLQAHPPELLVPLPVVPHGLDQLPHGHLLVVEDHLLDGGQGIGDRVQAEEGHVPVVGLVVPVPHVLGPVDAIVDQGGKEGPWCVLLVQGIGDVPDEHEPVDHPLVVLHRGVEQCIHGG